MDIFLAGPVGFLLEADLETGLMRIPFSFYKSLTKSGFQVKRLTCYQDESRIDKAMLIQISSHDTHPAYGLLVKNCGAVACDNILRISYREVSYDDSTNSRPTINDFKGALPDTPHLESLSECQSYFDSSLTGN